MVKVGRDADPWGPIKRQMVYEAVLACPGLHKSELCRQTGLAWGTVSHHLSILRRWNLVSYCRIAGRTHVAPARHEGTSQALLMPHSRAILSLLRRVGPRGPSAIASDLSIGRKLVRSHLEALVEGNLVQKDDAYHPRYWVSGRLG